jgi:hypothetical protein
MKKSMLVDLQVASSARFFANDAVSKVVGRSMQVTSCINGYNVIIAMQKWQLEKGQPIGWLQLHTNCMYEDHGTILCYWCQRSTGML